jgi:enoyl-CoA hydratase/3-hydroxyacyl-CoA dehydrogenase
MGEKISTVNIPSFSIIVDLIRSELKDGILRLTLSRPEKLNALSRQMWIGLTDLLTGAESNEDVEVVILTGSGKAFCAGDDIADLAALGSQQDAEDLFLGVIANALRAMVKFTKPVVAAVNGLAYGGGCELLFLCDVVVGGKSSSYALPEARIGAVPPISARLAPASIGLKRTKSMLLLCDSIDAEEARRIGLIDRVVDDQLLMQAAEHSAKEILKIPRHSRRAIKRLLSSHVQLDLLEDSLRSLVQASLEPDFKEGVRAFLEKRQPNFSSR